MTVTIRLFAILRDRAGADELRVSLPRQITVAEVVEKICVQCPTLKPLLTAAATAVNREYVARDHVLQDGDELALLPPVSGGAG